MWSPTFVVGVVRRCARAVARLAGVRPRRRFVAAPLARGTLWTCGVSHPRMNPPSRSGCIRNPMRIDAPHLGRLCRLVDRRRLRRRLCVVVSTMSVVAQGRSAPRIGLRPAWRSDIPSVVRGGLGLGWACGVRNAALRPGLPAWLPVCRTRGREAAGLVRATCGVALVVACGYLSSRFITPRVHSSCSEHLASSAIRFSSKCVSVSRYTTTPVRPLR